MNIPLIFSKGLMNTFKSIFKDEIFLTIKNVDNETTNQGCGMDIVKMIVRKFILHIIFTRIIRLI